MDSDKYRRDEPVSPTTAEQARSSSVEDIVIPRHLIGARNGSKRYSRRDTSGERTIFWQNRLLRQATLPRTDAFVPAPRAAVSRSNSITLGELGRGHVRGYDSVAAHPFAIEGRRRDGLRKTSLPNIKEGESQSVPAYAPDTTELVERYRGAVMFRSLQGFTFERDGSTAAHKDGRSPVFVDNIRSSFEQDPHAVTEDQPHTAARRDTLVSRAATVIRNTKNVLQKQSSNVAETLRRGSLWTVYEKAKIRGKHLQRERWAQILWQYGVYTLLASFVYFVMIGLPLWKGAVYWLYWVFAHEFVVPGTFSITIGIAAIYAFSPLLVLFEKDLPKRDLPDDYDLEKLPGVRNTALLIPCYKSAGLIAATLEAALKTFPPSHIFVIANGNSATALDNTEEVVRPYGVNYVWSPIGSKIVAQFVGCYAAKNFDNVLLIDDDCALPPNFPVVSDRIKGRVKCIGYTIKSVGPKSSKGTLCQQAQDLEYKISGLQRAFAGCIGSATFPHGAISIWDRKVLVQTFNEHPGFSVSEDWFFGHVARKLGCRIKMCTSVFVETETPANVFFNGGGGERGGFGEMTVFSQRFKRWNFFFVNGIYYNMAYILGSWKLGFWELGAKLFVFQEVYETLLYLMAPIVLPISFIVRPSFMGYLMAGTFGLYYANAIIFNEFHLRRKNERCGFVVTYLYYMPYKIVLTAVNVASCYWSLIKYAQYFAVRHPKIIEDERAIEVVLRLEEEHYSSDSDAGGSRSSRSAGRRLTVTAIGTRVNFEDGEDVAKEKNERVWGVDAEDFATGWKNRQLSFEPGVPDVLRPKGRFSK